MTATSTLRDHGERLAAIDRLAPGFQERRRQHDDAATFPAANFEDLRRAELLALTIPAEYGGDDLWWGTKFVDYYEVIERIARADSNTAQLLQVHSHATGIIARHATEAQRERYLPDIVGNGKLVASVGSESAPGSRRSGTYESELERTPDGWRLTCHKHFASLGPAADYHLLWVAVPGDEPYELRTVTILVPADAPEVELIDEWDVMGMRSTVSWSVRITDYLVPEEAIIGEPGAWVRNDPRTFTLGFTANHVGSAQAALDFAIDWVRDRPYLGGSDLVQHMIGDMAAEVMGARAALSEAARAWETGENDRAELESLKALHLAKRVSLDTTRRAFDVCGARVAFRDHPLEQLYRDVRTFTLHFRDEIYTKNLGQGIIEGSFSAKGFVEGATRGVRGA